MSTALVLQGPPDPEKTLTTSESAPASGNDLRDMQSQTRPGPQPLAATKSAGSSGEENISLNTSLREKRQRRTLLAQMYLDRVKQEDEATVKKWRDDMDSLLLFSTLFSAVSTAFLVSTYAELSTSNSAQVDQAELIARIVVALRDGSSGVPGHDSALLATTPGPSPADLEVNILWFISLVLSLAAAFLAVLAKQWIIHFEEGYDADPKLRSRQRALRATAMDAWHMRSVLSFISALLHIALVFFFVGLLVFLRQLQHTLANVISVLVALILGFYAATVIIPVFSVHFPFRTSVSEVIRRSPVHLAGIALWIVRNTLLLFRHPFAFVAVFVIILFRTSANLSGIFRDIETLRSYPKFVFWMAASLRPSIVRKYKQKVHIMNRYLRAQLNHMSFHLSRREKAVVSSHTYAKKLDAVVLAELLSRKETAENMEELVSLLFSEKDGRFKDRAAIGELFADSNGLLPNHALAIILSLSDYLSGLLSKPEKHCERPQRITQSLHLLTVLTTEAGDTSWPKSEFCLPSASGKLVYPVHPLGGTDYIEPLERILARLRRFPLENFTLAMRSNAVRIHATLRVEDNAYEFLDQVLQTKTLSELDGDYVAQRGVPRTCTFIVLRSAARRFDGDDIDDVTLKGLAALASMMQLPHLTIQACHQILWGISALLDPPLSDSQPPLLIPFIDNSQLFGRRFGHFLVSCPSFDITKPLSTADQLAAQVELLGIAGVLSRTIAFASLKGHSGANGNPSDKANDKPSSSGKHDQGKCLEILRRTLPKFSRYLKNIADRKSAIVKDKERAPADWSLLIPLMHTLYLIAESKFSWADQSFSGNTDDDHAMHLQDVLTYSHRVLFFVSNHIDTAPTYCWTRPSVLFRVACQMIGPAPHDPASKPEDLFQDVLFDGLKNLGSDEVSSIGESEGRSGESSPSEEPLMRLLMPDPSQFDLEYHGSHITPTDIRDILRLAKNVLQRPLSGLTRHHKTLKTRDSDSDRFTIHNTLGKILQLLSQSPYPDTLVKEVTDPEDKGARLANDRKVLARVILKGFASALPHPDVPRPPETVYRSLLELTMITLSTLQDETTHFIHIASAAKALYGWNVAATNTGLDDLTFVLCHDILPRCFSLGASSGRLEVETLGTSGGIGDSIVSILNSIDGNLVDRVCGEPQGEDLLLAGFQILRVLIQYRHKELWNKFLETLELFKSCDRERLRDLVDEIRRGPSLPIATLRPASVASSMEKMSIQSDTEAQYDRATAGSPNGTRRRQLIKPLLNQVKIG